VKIYVLEDAQRRIKVAAETPWHVSDAGDLTGTVGPVGDVPIKYGDATLLNDPDPCNQPQQSRFTDTVRPDHSYHAARRQLDRNVIKSKRFSVAMRNVLNPRYDAVSH